MENPVIHPLEAILRQCAQANPNPWYPSTFAQATGVSRDSLDPYLEQLRLAGLVRLTDWMPGTGQGYVLTLAGTEVLQTPRLLDRLRAGQVPVHANGSPPRDLREVRGTSWERGEAAREALAGSSAAPWATSSLILVNLLVFVAGLSLTVSRHLPTNAYLFPGVVGPQQVNNRDWQVFREVQAIRETTGSLSGTAVYVHGEWWRLLTNCFVHIGLIHLLVNMYSLYAVGPLLERLWGPWRFLVLYLIAGLGGSCGMLIESPVIPGAGASGAIWGILASLGTWLYLNRRALPYSLIANMRRQLLTVLILNIGITFAIPHISKGAHFGGGIIGLITGVPLDYLRFGTPKQRLFALVGLVAIPLLCVGLLVDSFHRSGEVIEWTDYRIQCSTFPAEKALDFYNEQVVPFVNQPRGRQDPAATKRILEGVAQNTAGLTALADRLESAGPYKSPQVETTRQQFVKEIHDLLERLRKAQAVLCRDDENHVL